MSNPQLSASLFYLSGSTLLTNAISSVSTVTGLACTIIGADIVDAVGVDVTNRRISTALIYI